MPLAFPRIPISLARVPIVKLWLELFDGAYEPGHSLPVCRGEIRSFAAPRGASTCKLRAAGGSARRSCTPQVGFELLDPCHKRCTFGNPPVAFVLADGAESYAGRFFGLRRALRLLAALQKGVLRFGVLSTLA